MQFLRRWWTAFKELLSSKLAQADSPRPQGEGPYVSKGGKVARFVFKERDLIKSGSQVGLPKSGAFRLDFHPELARHEVSICGLRNVAIERLWHLGRTIRQQEGLSAIAALRLDVGRIEGLTLRCEPAPMEDFAEHGVIINWPSGDDNKSAREDLRNGLAAMVTRDDVLQPPGPPK